MLGWIIIIIKNPTLTHPAQAGITHTDNLQITTAHMACMADATVALHNAISGPAELGGRESEAMVVLRRVPRFPQLHLEWRKLSWRIDVTNESPQVQECLLLLQAHIIRHGRIGVMLTVIHLLTSTSCIPPLSYIPYATPLCAYIHPACVSSHVADFLPRGRG